MSIVSCCHAVINVTVPLGVPWFAVNYSKHKTRRV